MAITLDDITLSVIGAFIGLAVTLPITYFIVDRIVQKNEEKRLAPVERMAKERLKSRLGVGSLTTFLITLVIDVTSAVQERRSIPRDIVESYISKLKTAQSDLEMLLGIYNRVLAVEVEHLTGNIISQIEHLQEDFQYLAELYPKPPTGTHAAHIEDIIHRAVHLTKETLQQLDEEDMQITGLEEWLNEFAKQKITPEKGEAVEVSGKHRIA